MIESFKLYDAIVSIQVQHIQFIMLTYIVNDRKSIVNFYLICNSTFCVAESLVPRTLLRFMSVAPARVALDFPSMPAVLRTAVSFPAVVAGVRLSRSSAVKYDRCLLVLGL